MPKTKRGSAGGSGHHHSGKAERKAQHIKSSEKKRGVSEKRAKQIAWATVHKDMPHAERETKERS
ncbi:MAG: hypothetical protein ACREBS_02780 [Nitrososphaerales archaeon]